MFKLFEEETTSCIIAMDNTINYLENDRVINKLTLDCWTVSLGMLEVVAISYRDAESELKMVGEVLALKNQAIKVVNQTVKKHSDRTYDITNQDTMYPAGHAVRLRPVELSSECTNNVTTTHYEIIADIIFTKTDESLILRKDLEDKFTISKFEIDYKVSPLFIPSEKGGKWYNTVNSINEIKWIQKRVK